MVGAAPGEKLALERTAVANVLGHEHALLAQCGGEDVGVGRTGQIRMGGIMNRCDVVATRAELRSHCRRGHLVEQQPQPSSSCSRAWAASSRSASASFALIHSSISSGYSP